MRVVQRAVTAARSSAGYWAIYLALTIYFCWPMFAHPDGLGISDWDQHTAFFGAVIKSVYGFGQLPFWNPWACGGEPLWQNPQVALLSPVYLLAPMMSLPLAIKINIGIHVLIGFAGVRRLVRVHFQNSYFPLELFLGCTFALASGITFHVGVGHATFLAFFYLPWALAWLLDAFDSGSLNAVAKAGAVLALAIVNGGAHAVAMFVLIIGIVTLVVSLLRRDWRPAASFGLAGVTAVLLSAPKLLPVIALFRDPRFSDTRAGLGEAATLTWSQVLTTLVGSAPRNWSGWYEFGNYIGVLAVALAAGAMWAAFDRRTRSTKGIGLTAGIALAVLLVRGRFSEWSPYALLQHVPVYSGFRVPSRYTLLVTVIVPALVADAVRQTARLWTGAGPRVLLTGVLAAGALDIAVTNRSIFEHAFTDRLLPGAETLTQRSGAPTLDAVTAGDGDDSPMTRALAENRDVIQCYESLRVAQTIAPDEPWISALPGTTVRDVTYGPSRVKLLATTQTAGGVTFNANYLAGWRSSAGKWQVRPTAAPQVLLAAGFSGPVTIRFVPPLLWLGVALLVAGLVAIRFGPTHLP
jgi:hypothetical protein